MTEAIENGIVIGAEAAWDAKEDLADKFKCLKADLETEIRASLDIGDMLEAIQEAPNSLHQCLLEALKESDPLSVWGVVSDMVGFYVDMLAEKRAREELGI